MAATVKALKTTKPINTNVSNLKIPQSFRARQFDARRLAESDDGYG